MNKQMGKLVKLKPRDDNEFTIQKPDHRKFLRELLTCRLRSKITFAQKNRNIFDSEDIVYIAPTHRPGVLIFREPGKPHVEYFLFTGRWDVINPDGTKYHKFESNPLKKLDAHDFMKWYKEQKVDNDDTIILLTDDPDLIKGT